MKRLLPALLALLGLVAAAGMLTACKHDVAPPPAASRPATSRPASEVAAVQAFATKINDSMARGDVEPMVAAIDLHIMIDRALEGLTLSPGARSGFETGFTRASPFRNIMQGVIKAGGSYQLLYVHQAGGEIRARFRLRDTNGFNYHDLVFQVDPSGAVRIVDLEIAATGELFSQTIHRLALPMVAHENRGIIARLTESDADFVKQYDQFIEMKDDAQAGRYADAEACYRRLPASMQKDQTIMLMHVMYSSKLGESAYLAAIDDFEKTFPTLSSVQLLKIDALYLRKQWPELLKAVDLLDAQVGPDPYLNLYRGRALMFNGDPVAARAAAEKGLAASPKMEELYSVLMEIAVQQKNWTDAVAVEDRMYKATKKYFPSRAGGNFAEFGATLEFKAWKAQHPELR